MSQLAPMMIVDEVLIRHLWPIQVLSPITRCPDPINMAEEQILTFFPIRAPVCRNSHLLNPKHLVSGNNRIMSGTIYLNRLFIRKVRFYICHAAAGTLCLCQNIFSRHYMRFRPSSRHIVGCSAGRSLSPQVCQCLLVVQSE